AHRVKEKLEIPSGSGQSRKQIVGEHGHSHVVRLAEVRGGGHFLRRRVDDIFEDGFGGFLRDWVANCGAEVLVAGPIANIQNDTPYEVRGEAAEENDDQDGKPLPQDGCSVAKGNFFNGIARSQAIGETCAHYPGERRYQETFLQAELFDRRA